MSDESTESVAEAAAEVASVSADISSSAVAASTAAQEVAADAVSTAHEASESADEAKDAVEESADAFSSFKKWAEDKISALEEKFQKERQDKAGEEDQSEGATDDVEPEEIPVGTKTEPETQGGVDNGQQQTASTRRHRWGR